MISACVLPLTLGQVYVIYCNFTTYCISSLGRRILRNIPVLFSLLEVRSSGSGFWLARLTLLGNEIISPIMLVSSLASKDVGKDA